MQYKDTIVFYNNDAEDLKKEFKSEFNKLIDIEKSEGLYTFYFSWYDNYKIKTELCYCLVTDKTAIFMWYTGSMVLELDPNLQVLSGDILPESIRFGDTFSGDESSTLIYLDTLCNLYGDVFEIYTVKYDNPLRYANEQLDNAWLCIDELRVDEDDMMFVSLEYLDETIDTFHNKVEDAIESDSPYIGLDENPYANRYYDKEFKIKMKQMNSGDNDV